MASRRKPASAQAAYWTRVRRLTALVFLAWFGLTFVLPWFARELAFDFFGWPFSFWLAAQGAPLVYIVLAGLYARRMERFDRRYGVAERDLP